MVMSEDYMNELLKYDFVSTKKGRGVSSILINRKKNEKQKDYYQQVESPSGILRPPAGVMDIKRWHTQLTPGQKAAYQRGVELERQSIKSEGDS